MPVYIYSHPKTKATKEIVQTMNEPHVYNENGIEWNRIFTLPQASIDANIDPFNKQQFIDKTGAKKGTMGDTWDRSAELSEKRAQKRDGVDPVKAKYFKDYAAKRKGKPHPKQLQEAANQTITV